MFFALRWVLLGAAAALALTACADAQPLAQAYWQAPYDPARAQAYARQLEQQGDTASAMLIRQRVARVEGHGQAVDSAQPPAHPPLPALWQ